MAATAHGGRPRAASGIVFVGNRVLRTFPAEALGTFGRAKERDARADIPVRADGTGKASGRGETSPPRLDERRQKCCEAPRAKEGREGGGGESLRDFSETPVGHPEDLAT
jgi:hypothetical protein